MGLNLGSLNDAGTLVNSLRVGVIRPYLLRDIATLTLGELTANNKTLQDITYVIID
jgi:hypothetical protein